MSASVQWRSSDIVFLHIDGAAGLAFDFHRLRKPPCARVSADPAPAGKRRQHTVSADGSNEPSRGDRQRAVYTPCRTTRILSLIRPPDRRIQRILRTEPSRTHTPWTSAR